MKRFAIVLAAVAAASLPVAASAQTGGPTTRHECPVCVGSQLPPHFPAPWRVHRGW